MRIHQFVIVLALAASSVSCDSAVKSKSELMPDVSPLVVLRPITARINDSGQVDVASSESTIDKTAKAMELSGSQFVNATKGWVFSNTSLWVTSDAAKTWKRLPVDLPADARLSSMFFIDESRGWLARSLRARSEPYGLDNSATVLATFDGGESWIEQASFLNGVQINRLKFLDANQGLAVGSRVKDHKPLYEEIFVAKTMDGGRTWVDITDKMRAAADNGAGFAPGQGRDVHWLSSNNIVLLMSGRPRLIATSDGGESWKTLAQFEVRPASELNSPVTFQKLLIDHEHRIRVIGRDTGDEGYRGDLLVQNDQQTWNSYELPGRPIFDAVFLSDSAVLAAAMQFGPAKDRRSIPPDGVLLYSSDLGQNWTQLYKSPATGPFIGLSKVAPNQFFAVSETGTVVRFTIKHGLDAPGQRPAKER